MTDDEPRAQITMSRIPIRGGVGAFAIILILVAGVLAELPQLRLRFLGGAAFGLVFAVALILWRRRTMDTKGLPPAARSPFAQVLTGDRPVPSAADEADEVSDRLRRPRRVRVIPPGARPRAAGAS
jgi:hypothetical protein